MPLLEIDDDVYQYLLRRASRIGEDGSSILRRELGLPQPGSTRNGVHNGRESAPNDQALADFLASHEFVNHRTATDRYLAVLGHLVKTHESDFEKVLEFGGRKRRYFGRTEAEVDRSGTSMYPRRIPRSEYWAMTNADTAQKRQILGDVLKELGYGKTMTSHAKTMIS